MFTIEQARVTSKIPDWLIAHMPWTNAIWVENDKVTAWCWIMKQLGYDVFITIDWVHLRCLALTDNWWCQYTIKQEWDKTKPCKILEILRNL